MEIDLTADLSILKSKLNDLEMKKQRLRQRQDKIDDLALDTLYKMEALLAKVKSVQNLASSNEETTTLSASNDYGVQSEKQRGNFTTSCERAHCALKILKSTMGQLMCINFKLKLEMGANVKHFSGEFCVFQHSSPKSLCTIFTILLTL